MTTFSLVGSAGLNVIAMRSRALEPETSRVPLASIDAPDKSRRDSSSSNRPDEIIDGRMAGPPKEGVTAGKRPRASCDRTKARDDRAVGRDAAGVTIFHENAAMAREKTTSQA